MAKTFGEVVAYCLSQRGMSQSDLARKIGTGRQTINSIIIGGRRGPTLETAVAIAEALDLTVDDLVAMMKED